MNFALLAVVLLALVLGAVAYFVWRPTKKPGPVSTAAPPRPEAARTAEAAAPSAELVLEPHAPLPRAKTVASTAMPRPDASLENAALEVGADFYAEVMGLLRAELDRAPQREDLRLKLLEVYAATERSDDFVKLAAVHLKALNDSREHPSWLPVQEMGGRLAPRHPLFAGDAGAHTAEPVRAVETRRSRRYYENVDGAALKQMSGELHQSWQTLRRDIRFWKKLRELAVHFVGPPPGLTPATKLTSFVGGAQILVRDESRRPESDAAVLAALGQVLLAQSLGAERVVASPADEGHAITVARAAHQLGLKAELIVAHDEEAPRAEELARLHEAGAQVDVASRGSGGNEGQREALARALGHGKRAMFVSPLAAGPFPYPVIVRELQGLTGLELKSQIQAAIEKLPDAIIVSASDGMPAIGILQAFLGSPNVALYCVEAGHGGGSRRHLLGREHNWLRASGRVSYSSVPAEVARFAAQHCMPDGGASALDLGGGELLVETFTRARAYKPGQVVVVVLPSQATAASQA